MVKREIEPRLVTVQEAAMLLGLSVWTVRGWAYRGVIASNKLGTRLCVPISEIERVIRESSRPRVEQR